MLKEAISFSREESERLNGNCIGTGHLLLAMIRQDNSAVVAVLKSLQVELPELRKEIERVAETEKGVNPAIGKAKIFKFFSRPPRNSMALNAQAEKAIRESVLEAKQAKSEMVETTHLMLSILKNTENRGTEILGSFGVEYEKVAGQLRQAHSN